MPWPEDWIASADQRLEVLRRLSALHDSDEFDAEESALRDRFGRAPDPAKMLVRLFRLKARLDASGLRHVSWKDDSYVIQYADRVGLEELLHAKKVDLRLVKPGVAHLVPPLRVHARPEAALRWLEDLVE